MLHLIHVWDKKGNIRYVLEIQTRNVETHALMTDYPNTWEEIKESTREKLAQVVELDDKIR